MSAVRLRGLVLMLALPVVLAACAIRPVRPGLPPEQLPAAEALQQAREAALRLQPQWSLVGRIAVSNDGKGGSGRIEWRQDGPNFEVSLSAPVTRQSWRLTGTPGDARLEGLEGGVRQGADARALLLLATGWDIPVVALADWVRGMRTPGPQSARPGSEQIESAQLEPAQLQYGVDGRPAQIVQGGWQIDYTWPADRAATLPARVDARRGEARVRLIIDHWNEGGADE